MSRRPPLVPTRFPDRVDKIPFDLHAEQLRGPTPELDRKVVIDPTIGKAAPDKPSKTLFRKGG